MNEIRLRFDFADAAGVVRPVIFTNPMRIIEARTLDAVVSAMRAVEEAARLGSHVAGFVSYEAAPAFDPALTTHAPSDLPLVWFGVFDRAIRPDADEPQVDANAVTDPNWRSDLDPGEYARTIAIVREAIANGDSYQANYTFRLHTNLDVASLSARYERLREDQRPPYAADLDIGRWRIQSLSPELFFRRTGDQLTSRPMKGTAQRGLWSDDDRRRAADLAASAKNRAENVMIVDLVRNDIGRVAEIGSVEVASLFDVEQYPAVFQLVSTVEGRVRPDVGLVDVFGALFPAGSITGAPKTSSMRLIAGIERTPRGVYCGAIGYVSPGGDAVFNVAIRTAVTDTTSGDTTCGVGGGITWDSDSHDEHAEALSKASFLSPQPSFDLLETLRLERGELVRFAGHLRRLSASADYFGFRWDEGLLRDALAEHVTAHAVETRRVRVRLSRQGRVTVESRALDPAPTGPVHVALAEHPVSRRDRFLYHKTTHRHVYDAHRGAHSGAFDVLLWNEDGELTEFTIGNVVLDLDGSRLTPPVACGLLGGVFRQELLDTNQVRGRVLSLDDLSRATRVWLVNSLREWVEVRFCG
jgi:para-aminobenzoate synthetase/4-amino-4-deoxychorismate lyase